MPTTAPTITTMPEDRAATAARQDLARITLAVLCLLVLIAASLWVLRPFLLASVWATMLVVSTWPMMKALQARLGNRRAPAVALMTLAMLLLLIVPLWAALATLVAAVAAGWHFASRPPDLDGTWDFPNGSYWIVEQTGHELTIQEVHHNSGEVWKKGRGTIVGNVVEFKLDLVYERGYSTEGQLRIADRGRRLTGVAVTRPRNTRDDVVLSKR